LGPALALAYEANPLVRWMFADDLSPARLGGLFTSLVEFGLRHGLVYRSRDGDGAAIWFQPLSKGGSRPSDEASDVATDTAEWSSIRRSAALDALASERPTVAHFYLDAVGVLPLSRRHALPPICSHRSLPSAMPRGSAPTSRTRIPPTLVSTATWGSGKPLRFRCPRVLHRSFRCGEIRGQIGDSPPNEARVDTDAEDLLPPSSTFSSQQSGRAPRIAKAGGRTAGFAHTTRRDVSQLPLR
jgi:hypothetical protein